ncbi:unnamed protein product [Closterium sp. Naga37s-1]|nr:unnamed protein product [Closterium sp. Naga37s-1]
MPKGAYTTTRTFGGGSHLLLWDFHVDRVTQSLLLLAEAHPELFPNLSPNLLSIRHEAQEEEISQEEDQKKADQIRDLVADLRKDIRASVFAAVQEMVECDWWRRNVQGEQNGEQQEQPQQQQQQQQQQQVEICLMILLCGKKVFVAEAATAATAPVIRETAETEATAAHARGVEVYVHASTVRTTSPLTSLSLPPPVCAAVMGPGRDTPLAKFSSWPLVRRVLEAARPAEANDVILSNDGDALLEGITSNLFVVARTEPASDSNPSRGSSWHGFELQTSSLESGILPGSIRRAIIDTCVERGIPLRIKTPRWNKRALWVEAFVTNALGIVQPVSSILMPATWPHEITYDSWQSVDNWLTWQAPTLEDGVNSHSAILLGHVRKLQQQQQQQQQGRRAFCVECHKATSVCICDRFGEPVDNRVGVTILQHPKEKYHPLGSARIALLGLQRVRVVVVPLGRGRPGLQPKDPCSRRSLLGRSGRGRWRKGAGKTQGQGRNQGGGQGGGPGEEKMQGQWNGQGHGQGVDQREGEGHGQGQWQWLGEEQGYLEGRMLQEVEEPKQGRWVDQAQGKGDSSEKSNATDGEASMGTGGGLMVATADGERGEVRGGEVGDGEVGEGCVENGVEREESRDVGASGPVMGEEQGGETGDGASADDSSFNLSFDLLPFAAADGADSGNGAGTFGSDHYADGSSEEDGGATAAVAVVPATK